MAPSIVGSKRRSALAVALAGLVAGMSGIGCDRVDPSAPAGEADPPTSREVPAGAVVAEVPAAAGAGGPGDRKSVV